MDEDKLKGVFDQIKPTPEGEQAMLDRLLTMERRGRPMKKMKKLTAALAAAVLLLACAFTVATGLDQRLLALFSGGARDPGLIADGVVSIHHSRTYENGWTVELKQALVDRYSMAVLVDVTAPEGTALEGDDYFIRFSSVLTPEPEERGVGGWVSGSRLLEDDDPKDNRISFLWYRGPTSFLNAETQQFIGHSAELRPLWLGKNWVSGTLADFSQDKRTCTVELPGQDSGLEYQVGREIAVGEEGMTVEKLYISPISAAFQLTGQADDPRMWGPPGLAGVAETITLHMAAGEEVAMERSVSQSYDPVQGRGEFVFQPRQVIDPAQVTSITILGQTFSLEGLSPAEQ